MGRRGRVEVRVRLEATWFAEIEARCEAEGIARAKHGRTGGPSEWLRRVVAQVLGHTPQADPHLLARERLKGQPNLNHPTLFGRPTGRRAAKLAQEERERQRAQPGPPLPAPLPDDDWCWGDEDFARSEEA